MKWQKGLLVLVIFLIVEGLWSGFASKATVAEEIVTVDVIRNGFALGVNNDHCPAGHDPDEEVINSAEWTYDEYITISKCGAHKNSHPYDLEIGGTMFKNGPIENSGFGLPNVPAHMWQVYDLAALGVPVDAPVTVDLTLELVSVGEYRLRPFSNPALTARFGPQKQRSCNGRRKTVACGNIRFIVERPLSIMNRTIGWH